MHARFWGVRGSIPVSGPGYARYGGNTSCVEVRCGGSVLVFDAGTGLRPLGAALVREGCADLDLFLTHGHIDHVVGLPFFALAYRPGNSLRVWSGHQGPGGGTTESTVRSLMSSPLLPITPDIFPAEVSFRDFSAGDDLAPPCGVSIRTARLRHPGGATGYRVDCGGRSICYVTDTEHEPDAPDENILTLVDGADILIYDAMFTDEELPATGDGAIRPGRKGRGCAARRGSGPMRSSTMPRSATTRRSTGSAPPPSGCFRAPWWPAKAWSSLPDPGVAPAPTHRGRFDGTVDLRYVIRHSLRAQVVLTLLAVASFPFLYAFYEVPKQIVNQVIPGRPGRLPGCRARRLPVPDRVPVHPLRRVSPPRGRSTRRSST